MASTTLGRWRKKDLPAHAALLGLLSLPILAACASGGPVHEPRTYPEIKIDAAELNLQVLDRRSVQTEIPGAPSGMYVGETRHDALPVDKSIHQEARQRLARLSSGKGPRLNVQMSIEDATATYSADARGEWTRINVLLVFEARAEDGTPIQKGQSESSSELPSDQATPSEVKAELRSTVLDAFDRYWAAESTLNRLKANWQKYQARHPK